ncbi:MAG: hypothetical protein HYS53_03370 [Candidatus Aenigmarchaeota archaeon]|nr:hypothetical protein [Candidatus Aenigmarchaeota archaeon]
MTDLLISASIITAFVGGIAALFAPCCITVLLPAYLGSIFRQRRTIFLMTFIFFLGLLAVFLPLGLGMASLGKLFTNNHDTLFAAGGLFFVILGLSILTGRHFSLPFSIHPKVNIKNAGSVFVLGIFSGFATLCCAPVLAGVLALSVLPGSLFWGAVYSLAYVLGMTIPLFVIAYFLDKSDITNKLSIFRKKVSYSFAGGRVSITMSELLSGSMFFLMGLLLIYLTYTGQLAMSSGYQTTVNIYVSNIAEYLKGVLGSLPAAVWPAFVAVLLLLITKAALKKKK